MPAAVGGHVLDAGRLDPPPVVVEELEERVGGLGELLVEAPLVLVVVAAHPPRHPLDRVAQGLRQLAGGGLDRGQRVDPAVDRRRGRRAGSARRLAGAAARRRRRSSRRPGEPARGSRRCPGAGARRRPVLGAGEVADRAGRVEARLDSRARRASAGCRRRGRSGAAGSRRRRGRRRRGCFPSRDMRRREQRVRERRPGCGRASRSARESEIDPLGATLTAPRTGSIVAASERAGRVVGVDELQPRVEAELGGDGGQRQVAASGERRPGPDLGLVAEHAAGQLASGGGRSSRSSPRARRCRAGSGSAAGTRAPSPR